MLTQGRFLISYQVFDNIPVNNNGQTHVRIILYNTKGYPGLYLQLSNRTNKRLPQISWRGTYIRTSTYD